MKITIESTSKVVMVNGIYCRIWTGFTESGIPMHCFIPRVAVDRDEDSAEFEKELQEVTRPTAEIAAIPIWLLI